MHRASAVPRVATRGRWSSWRRRKAGLEVDGNAGGGLEGVRVRVPASVFGVGRASTGT